MGRGSNGRVKWDLAPFPSPPSEQEIVTVSVDRIVKRLRERLNSPPSRWRGLAAWVEKELKIDGSAITWPTSAAVDRSELMDVEQRWLDEAATEALKAKK